MKRSYIDQYESNGISDPPIELLEAIKDDLGSKEWFRSSYSDIYDRFGSIRWNYAYFSVSDEHRYVVSLPYVNSDHKILGIMIAQGHDDHYDYSFRSRNELFDVAINEEYQYEDAIANIAILTLNSLEISRNHVVIEQYNSFARNFGEYAQSVSTPRTTEITWTTYGSEMYEGWAAAVITEHKAILPCGGGGSGGGGDLFSDGDNGDITTGGTTTNDNNNEEDREVIIAEIENILANIEECDKLTMTAEAKELIAAQASMMDPCQPDKTAMELLEELLAEICKNKEGINTDGGAITDFDNIDVGDGIIGEEDVMEAIDDLNELSTQFNDYLSGITNTNDCTDQYIEDLYNILENSDCDLSNFASSYSDYFGITESTEQQTVPSLNIGDILCPNIFSVTSLLILSLLSCESTKEIDGVYTTKSNKIIMHVQGEAINIYFSPVALHCSSFQMISQENDKYTVLNLDQMKALSYEEDTLNLYHQNDKLIFGEYIYKPVSEVRTDSILQYNHQNGKTIKNTIHKDYPKFEVLANMIALQDFNGFPKDLTADNCYTNFLMYFNGEILAKWETAHVPICLDLYSGYFPE